MDRFYALVKQLIKSANSAFKLRCGPQNRISG